MLHITENGVQDVNGGIAQNGNGAVTGVTIQMNGFSPFVMIKAGEVLTIERGFHCRERTHLLLLAISPSAWTENRKCSENNGRWA